MLSHPLIINYYKDQIEGWIDGYLVGHSAGFTSGQHSGENNSRSKILTALGLEDVISQTNAGIKDLKNEVRHLHKALLVHEGMDKDEILSLGGRIED